MAYICYKTGGCNGCSHHRYDEERDEKVCWAQQDMVRFDQLRPGDKFEHYGKEYLACSLMGKPLAMDMASFSMVRVPAEEPVLPLEQ